MRTNHRCPHCQSANFLLHQINKRQGLYQCHDCNKLFEFIPNSPSSPRTTSPSPPWKPRYGWKSRLVDRATSALLRLTAAAVTVTLLISAIWFIGPLIFESPNKNTAAQLSRGPNEQSPPNLLTTTFPFVPLPEIDGWFSQDKQEAPKTDRLHQYLLDRTNEERAKEGLEPVRMGNNPAAQLHAEAALKHCASSHWDVWGLKPNHRYSLTGGTGTGTENIYGLDYCIQKEDNYNPIDDPEREIGKAIENWLNSYGHRKNMMDPKHTVLNPGFASNKYNSVVVQQFSSDYIRYSRKPFISEDNILYFKGSTNNAYLNPKRRETFTVTFHPEPKELLPGQLARTYRLCPDPTVATITEIGHLYIGGSWARQNALCQNPYSIPADAPAPASVDESTETWEQAKLNSEKSTDIISHDYNILWANSFHATTTKFNVSVDISQTLNEYGRGIYTLQIWGETEDSAEATILSEQAVFWRTEPAPGSPYD